MESRVWFTSSRFAPVAGEEDVTNPGRHGQALAAWLREALLARGVSVDSVIPEDWGWLVMLQRKPFLLWVGCGNDEGSSERWALFISAEVPWLKRLFGGPDTRPAISSLRAQLEAILASDPAIQDVTWE